MSGNIKSGITNTFDKYEKHTNDVTGHSQSRSYLELVGHDSKCIDI